MTAKSILVIVIASVLVAPSMASAELVQGISMDFVTIGNPGNPSDTQVMVTDGTTGYGAVSYEYRIGKYEVTNAQWYDFVGAAGVPAGNLRDAYDENPEWTDESIPANRISWYEAVQFCNYLTSGDKSQGAYQFSGNNSNPGDFEGIDRASAVSTYGVVYVLPAEDEWYKAAYYTDNGYSTFANGTGIAPIAGVEANYNGVIGQPWDVGSGVQEQNGTFDMMGNISEWNESRIDVFFRGHRGGAFIDDGYDHLMSSYRDRLPDEQPDLIMGFRVAAIPEPATLLLLGLGGLMLRKRR